MGVYCFYVNQEFLKQLALATSRPAFLSYSNLFTPYTTKESPLFGSHHLVELQHQNYCIAVDVAAEQYRNDKTVAEIFIAATHDDLDKMLLARYKLEHSWLVNEIRTDSRLSFLLKEERQVPKTEEPEAESHIAQPAGCSCTIL